MIELRVNKSRLSSTKASALPAKISWFLRIAGLMTILLATEEGLLFPAIQAVRAENWPCWRGPRSDGTCIEKNVPTNWDPAGALWEIELPGKGHASPIVWGNHVCTVTGIVSTKERILLCVNRTNGKMLWQETVVQGPLQKLHKENSYASSTPATDGSRVFVTFRVGDEIVVAAHDLATGEQLWQVRPGTHKGEWGFCNPPVLFENKVFVDGDGKDKSFLIALKQSDGETVWRKDRKNKGISYSAPFIRELAGRTQLIQCGDRSVAGFDPRTGEQFWIVDGPSQEFVATPVYSENAGLIFISSSWPKQVLFAIRPDGKGNVTNTHVAWSDRDGAPYIPSMMIVGDLLFSVNRGGTVFCYEAATGNVFWQKKLGRHHASPVLVNGLLFFINDDGQINVIRPGRQFESVGTYELGEKCYASPAISDGQVFLRGFRHLFCLGSR